MSTYKPGDPTEIKSRHQFVDYFAARSAERGRMGMEWEQLPVTPDSRLVPYDGPGGVESALASLVLEHEAVLEGGRITAVRLDGGGMVGLEPGAQVEIASPPVESLNALQRFMARSLHEVGGAARALGFRLVPWGAAPYNGAEDLPDVPKRRYVRLKEHLLKAGTRGRRMMKLTASTQYNIDYEGEDDLRAKVRASLALQPYLLAYTANSPISKGRRARWLTQRPWIWKGTDVRRCGLPRFLFSGRAGYEEFARYALTRPVLFLVRDSCYVPGDGRSFLGWWKSPPSKVGPVTFGDWALHLSTLFPDVRLRPGYLEIRALDSMPLALDLSVAAVLKGLLCDPDTLAEWVSRMPPLPAAGSYQRLVLDAARQGPRWTPPPGWPAPRTAMRLLLAAAARGLAALGEEEAWLDPVRRLVERNLCPADLWHRDGHGVWRGPEEPERG